MSVFNEARTNLIIKGTVLISAFQSMQGANVQKKEGRKAIILERLGSYLG